MFKASLTAKGKLKTAKVATDRKLVNIYTSVIPFYPQDTCTQTSNFLNLGTPSFRRKLFYHSGIISFFAIMDSFEFVNLSDVREKMEDNREDTGFQEKICNVCKGVCSVQLDEVCSFTVKLKFDKCICVSCQKYKLSQLQTFMKDMGAKLGFEILDNQQDMAAKLGYEILNKQEGMDEKESDFGKKLYSNYRFYPGNLSDILSSKNEMRQPVDDSDKCLSKLPTLCSYCLCDTNDNPCSLCIEENFKCQGSCSCCSSHRCGIKRTSTDDGIEVLYEEKEAPRSKELKKTG